MYMDRYIDLFQFCACRFHGNSMNNLLSYCGLVDANIRADKDLPVKVTKMPLFDPSTSFGLNDC